MLESENEFNDEDKSSFNYTVRLEYPDLNSILFYTSLRIQLIRNKSQQLTNIKTSKHKTS